MGRGIFSGMIWGGLTGGLVVSVLSLYAPVPAERSAALTPSVEDKPVAPEQVAEPGEAVPTNDEDTTPAASQPVTVPEAATDPEVVADPEAGTDSSQVAPTSNDDSVTTDVGQTENSTTQIADVPETDAVEADVPVANVPAADVGVEAEAAEVVVVETAEAAVAASTPTEDAPAVQARAPQTASASVTQRVAQVPASDSAVPGRASPLLQGNAASSDAGLLLDDAAPSAPERTAEVTRAPSTPAISETTAMLLSSATSISPTAPAPGGLAAPLAEATPEADLQAAARIVTDNVEEPDVASQTPEVTPVSSDTPIKLPVPQIENPVSNVVINRLPSVVTPEAETAPETDGAPEVVVQDASEVGALRAYAAAFEGEPSSGMFSVILIDAGAQSMPRNELLQLELPFSIAIDPSQPGAGAAAKAYREAGIEVLVLANDLPETAVPSDVAVALSGYFDVLDQAIAVLDPVDGRIQNNRDLLQPVLGTIRDSGHGLVTYDRGLNSAQQAARREGIASATVFRLLDAEQEEAPRIKRYLNRAAFTASKEGAVVVVGHSYPDTVKAMLEWALDEKTAELSIVPVSQVMLREDG